MKFNKAKPFTTCTNKKTKEIVYLQSGNVFSRKDFDKAKFEPDVAEDVNPSGTSTTVKIIYPDDENPDVPSPVIDKKTLLADVTKHDNIVADPSQTEGADEVKLYKTKASAKATITRNSWKAEDYEILPYQDKFIIQKKAE